MSISHRDIRKGATFVDRDNIEHTEFESDNYRRDVELAAAENKYVVKSCLKCSHFEVCTIFRNVHPMMEQMFGMLQKDDQPFQAEQLAWLCKKYELKKPKPVQEEEQQRQ